MNLFSIVDYRSLVETCAKGQGDRGTRTRLARAAACSPSWLTRVLAGTVHLTPDQALGIAVHLHLSEAETDYFLLLVDQERAATPAMKKRLQVRIDRLRRDGKKLAPSVKVDSKVSEEGAIKYYSSWVNAAVHVACMIKAQSPKDLSEILNLPVKQITKTLRELGQLGLLTASGDTWSANSKNVHLPATHPIARLTHTLWRNRTNQFLQESHDDGLHYSAIHCLSKSDVDKIQETLTDCILKTRQKINESPSETLVVFCLDWYRLEQ
ncbi:MAG: DUF4423 domain-containing protein [Deltaproteobacteria bacterium]|jgi:uncharacterized protein (TIGR02147 family)|nr:DUF4423 domain-containing protein [Deltaproteobacteria bacterium]